MNILNLVVFCLCWLFLSNVCQSNETLAWHLSLKILFYILTSYITVTSLVLLIVDILLSGSGQVSPMICSDDSAWSTICVIVILRQTLIVKEFAKANRPIIPRTYRWGMKRTEKYNKLDQYLKYKIYDWIMLTYRKISWWFV